VIRRYGILNTEVRPGDIPVYGGPFPGTFVTDEDGVVIGKSFHDSYKKRDSAEDLIDCALGEIRISDTVPRTSGGDDDIRVTAFFHGGRGTLRQGILRRLVVRFELREGLHIYAEPVPEGMVATTISVQGPPDLVTEDPILPPTSRLRLDALDLDLSVWSGTVDIAIPVYARSNLVSECRPIDRDSVSIDVTVRYQACDDHTCFAPKTQRLRLELGLEPVDMPNLSFHGETGQWTSPIRGAPHMRRLLLRMLVRHPFGVVRSIVNQVRLMRAARRRQARQTASRVIEAGGAAPE
jgi:hypothetical protein